MQTSGAVWQLAEQLVRLDSVSGSAGEGQLGEWLVAWLAKKLQDCPWAEQWTRAGVFEAAAAGRARPVACFLPALKPTAATLILLGHYDTVGLEPFGAAAPVALDSAALKRLYADSPDAGLREQAASADWAFGRGSLDMKGGVAAALLAFVYFAQSQFLHSNLLLLLTPDEEGQSSGIRSALPVIARALADRGAQPTQVLNVDYCEPGPDFRPPLYSGTVGKLLLGLNVLGLPGHASEPFAGCNANALAAALAAGLEHNPRLTAQSGGEWLPPPSVLMLRDSRSRYDVTTAQSAQLYVNILHLAHRPAQLWPLILQELRRIGRHWDRALRRRHNQYCSRSNTRPARVSLRPELLDYPQLCQRLGRPVRLPDSAALAASADPAALLLEHIEAAAFELPRARPLVIASLLPPFYPAQLMQRRSRQEEALQFFARSQHLPLRRAYAYISDLSFFSFEADSLADWRRLAPAWYSDAESAAFAALRAPVTNLGPQGYGAHSALERVHLPSLERLVPKLIGLLIVLGHTD